MTEETGKKQPIRPGRTKRDRKGHRTGVQAALRSERAAEILQKRLAGWTLEKIAASQSPRLSPQRIYQIISVTLTEHLHEPLEEVRALELQRLDELTRAVWAKALDGDLGAVAATLKILERRAALLGLNAPVRIKAHVEPVEFRLEIEQAAAEFDRKLAARIAAAAPRPDQ